MDHQQIRCARGQQLQSHQNSINQQIRETKQSFFEHQNEISHQNFFEPQVEESPYRKRLDDLSPLDLLPGNYMKSKQLILTGGLLLNN